MRTAWNPSSMTATLGLRGDSRAKMLGQMPGLDRDPPVGDGVILPMLGSMRPVALRGTEFPVAARNGDKCLTATKTSMAIVALQGGKVALVGTVGPRVPLDPPGISLEFLSAVEAFGLGPFGWNAAPVMPPSVSRHGDKFEILKSVIGPVPVSVVNLLTWPQRAAKVGLHDDAMLKAVATAANIDSNVPASEDIPAAPPVGILGARQPLVLVGALPGAVNAMPLLRLRGERPELLAAFAALAKEHVTASDQVAFPIIITRWRAGGNDLLACGAGPWFNPKARPLRSQ